MEESGQIFAKQSSLKHLLESWKEMCAKLPDRGKGNEESNCIQRKGKKVRDSLARIVTERNSRFVFINKLWVCL